ncbi:MAG: APC family permease [Thermofilaceae archaeon]
MASLRRALGLGYATLFGIGLILGAGNYVLVGRAIGLVGDAGWVSAALAGVIALTVAFSYAELAGMFPYDSSVYRYVVEAFPRFKLLAFLAGWFLFFGAAAGASTDAIGFSNHVAQLTGRSDLVLPVALLLLASLTVLNWWGIEESALFAAILTLVELFGLGLVVVAGALWPTRSANYASFNPTVNPLGAIMAGAAILYFACSGFELQPTLCEETRDAERNVPKAIVLSVAIVAGVTVALSLSLVRLMSWEEVGASRAPLVDAAARAIPQAAQLLMLIALSATANSALGYMVAASRLLYGLSLEEVTWRKLGSVCRWRRTPHYSVALSGLMAIAIVALNELVPAATGWRPRINGFEYQLIDLVGKTASLAMLLASLLVNFSLIALRLKAPHLQRHYRTPLNVGSLPLLPLASSGLIAAFIIAGFNDWAVWLSTALVTALGLLLYRGADRRVAPRSCAGQPF